MNGLLNVNPHANKLQLFSVKIGLSQLSSRKQRVKINIQLVGRRIILSILTIFRMASFGAAQGCQICRKHPIIIRLGTVIPYVKKIQKIDESCVKSLEFY